MLKKLSIKIFLAFFLFASAAQSNTTIFQDFENTSSFLDNFTASTNSSGSFTYSGTGGIGNSGKVNIPSSSDVIYTTKQKYSIEDNGVYTLSALFHSQFNSGYGSFGFTTAATSNASGSQGSPAEASFGVSFHAGGGSWMNNNTLTSLTWANFLDVNITNAEWYLFKLIITDKTGGSFDLDFTIYNVNQTTGEITTILTNHKITITNTSVKSANDLYVFFGAEGQRMIGFDNFTIDLSDSVTVSGTQTGQTQSGGDETTDPTKKADVMGNIQATSNAAISFTSTSIKSVQHRLDWLRRNKDKEKTSHQGIKIAFSNPILNYVVNNNSLDFTTLTHQAVAHTNTSAQMNNPAIQTALSQMNKSASEMMKQVEDKYQVVSLNPNQSAGPLFNDWSIWTEGKIMAGSLDGNNGSANQESDTLNVAIGIDRPTANAGLVGVALNLGTDDVEVGSAGSGIESKNISLSLYNIIKTKNLLDVETQFGLGRMSIDTVRKDGSQTLNGDRDVMMPFASVAIRNKPFQYQAASLTPYGRAEWAYIELDSYTENGGNLALQYDKQKINRYMLFVGSDVNYETSFASGRLKPFAAFEYGLDLTSNSDVSMNYAGVNTKYQTQLEKVATSNVMLRLGLDYKREDETNFSISYERQEAIGAGNSDSIQFKFSKVLGKVN